ncbi:MAG: DNA adenine methylase [Chitinophagaceae bacterium]
MPAKKENTIVKQEVIAKPFLKWAGSKRQLLSKFETLYPQALKAGKIKNYYEPFLGSGAVFFNIVQRYTVENAFLSDVNPALVLTYQVIQANVSKLVDVLSMHQKRYDALPQQGRLQYFYQQRDEFNQQRFDENFTAKNSKGINRAAQVIFLNRTCYNGLFRVNSKGIFNTPAGRYINPSICDVENLQAVSALLRKATIQKADFTTTLKKVMPNSLVYIDPPYRPLSKTANFTAYSKSAFGDKEQAQLAKLYRKLDAKGALLMLSNSDTEDGFFDKLYQGFNLTRVPARRLINARVTGRGAVNELVVTNY